MKSDDFGDRMKEYEGVEASRRLMPLLPICVRIDGRTFSKYTSKLARPFDARLSQIMVDVTRYLLSETNACIGYTQSDEISLVIYHDTYASEPMFGGKVAKLCSVLASMATAQFNLLAGVPISRFTIPAQETSTVLNPYQTYILAKDVTGLATFDCRVWNVPNKVEAVNTILWREQDATKNAISMAARCYYSHAKLQNKSGSAMQEMLFQKGINFNNYPPFFKRGTFVQRRKVITTLTEEELARIPEPHRTAKKDEQIERSVIKQIEMPRFASVVNRVEVVFDGAEPVVMTEDADEHNTKTN